MSVKKKQKSPMHLVLDEINRGVNTANGVLARLWRIILRDRSINGHQWGRLLEHWLTQSEEIYGKGTASTTRNNLGKALAASDMTWKVFFKGLQILNATGAYSRIRFEIHFVRKRDGVTDVVGLDVIDQSKDRDGGEYDEVIVINPGAQVTPGHYYQLAGFDNTHLNGMVLRYVGTLPMDCCAKQFNGMSMNGLMLLDEDGMVSDSWIIRDVKESV